MACAFSGDEFPNPGIACARAEEMIQNLLADTQSDDCEVWLSGPKNFRSLVYPEYKANRIGMPRPRYEKAVKSFLVEYFDADYSDGVEADDMLGIRSTYLKDVGEEPIIIHLDKDMDQIPGLHFNWELRRKQKDGTIKVVREKTLYEILPEEGNRFFWYQLIIGDSTDNIKGVVGMGPQKANAFLENTDPQDWYQGILDLYGNEEEMDMNAKCVYIYRKPDDSWRNLIEQYSRKDQGTSIL